MDTTYVSYINIQKSEDNLNLLNIEKYTITRDIISLYSSFTNILTLLLNSRCNYQENNGSKSYCKYPQWFIVEITVESGKYGEIIFPVMVVNLH